MYCHGPCAMKAGNNSCFVIPHPDMKFEQKLLIQDCSPAARPEPPEQLEPTVTPARSPAARPEPPEPPEPTPQHPQAQGEPKPNLPRPRPWGPTCKYIIYAICSKASRPSSGPSTQYSTACATASTASTGTLGLILAPPPPQKKPRPRLPGSKELQKFLPRSGHASQNQKGPSCRPTNQRSQQQQRQHGNKMSNAHEAWHSFAI